MRQKETWQNDPIVRVEKHLYPLIPGLLRHSISAKAAGADLIRAVQEAASALRAAQHRYLDPIDIKLTPDTRSKFDDMANLLDRVAAALPDPAGLEATNFLDVEYLCGAFTDHVESTLDALRADFLNEVLARQERAKMLSTIAAKEVTSISRQIYFISINASVEAARAGDAGRGFAVIGEQIRGLSQDAAAALKRMSGSGARLQ